MARANTLNAKAHELGAGLGVAVGALLLRSGGQLSATIAAGNAPVAAFRVAFVLLAIMLLAPMIEAVRLPRSAGSTVTGRA